MQKYQLLKGIYMKKTLLTLLLVASYTMVAPQICYADETLKSDAVSKETAGQAISSATATLNVKAKLLAAKEIDSNKIKVTSKISKRNPEKAIVTLRGTQKSPSLVKKAGEVAKSAEGVGRVHNFLKVSNK
jgi:osmotically-inducible protein OsmY